MCWHIQRRFDIWSRYEVLTAVARFRTWNLVAEGIMTIGDILEILPFDDPTLVIEIDGATLWAALESALSTWPSQEGCVLFYFLFLLTTRRNAFLQVVSHPSLVSAWLGTLGRSPAIAFWASGFWYLRLKPILTRRLTSPIMQKNQSKIKWAEERTELFLVNTWFKAMTVLKLWQRARYWSTTNVARCWVPSSESLCSVCQSESTMLLFLAYFEV